VRHRSIEQCGHFTYDHFSRDWSVRLALAEHQYERCSGTAPIVQKPSVSLTVVLILAAVWACEGPAGPAGPAASEGAPGSQGEPGLSGNDGIPGATGDAGPRGEPGEGYVQLEPDGVTGYVRDRSGSAVSGGTIYFVPADDVAALPATTISANSPDDEPLEDSIADKGESFQKAPIGGDGRYVLKSLDSGSYFVTYMPATTDASHLPGGSTCRVARSREALVGTRLDIEVSQATPSDAHYIGTGRCVTCHGMMHISETLHRLGIWSPYEVGPLQNQAGREAEQHGMRDLSWSGFGALGASGAEQSHRVTVTTHTRA
jgi:hypothetical protein